MSDLNPSKDHQPPGTEKPANVSDLNTPEEIDREFEREELRFVRQEREDFRLLRGGFVVIFSILALIALGSAAAMFFAFATGRVLMLGSSLAMLGGSGAAAFRILRAYAERRPKRLRNRQHP